MLTAIEDGSFDFAQDDGVGRLRSQWACLGLVLVMHLRCISIRRYPPTRLASKEGALMGRLGASS